ncbi:MAG TPA: pyridoxamine 5'-phosphate oxidase family protein [Acidimicrobiales bacterium]|nr:pyridoxamine 5'-phosphate oxidase family protein [Acidimicrobiales bacterium]
MSGQIMLSEPMEELDRDQCLELLAAKNLGRVGFVATDGQPLILPVNYGLTDRAVVFRTAPGTKLSTLPMSRAAFEVDDVDGDAGVAWSVLVTGEAHDISDSYDQLAGELRGLPVAPAAPGDHPSWVEIYMREVTGRRFHLAG